MFTVSVIGEKGGTGKTTATAGLPLHANCAAATYEAWPVPKANAERVAKPQNR